MSPPPLPPANISSSYPKIPVSLYSATPSYGYPPGVPYLAYPSSAYGPAAYGHVQMPPNGAVYDYMSAMSGAAGMMDYSAYAAVANHYGYPSNQDRGATGQR